MANNITLNCFVRGETVQDIFEVVVDNTLDVENLKTKIRSARPNLSQNNFDLYKVDFFQPNPAIVSSVNSYNDGQGELIKSQKKISKYFNTVYINVHKCSYPQENGRIGSIHLLIYPIEG
ncbi:12428_t:CDS:1 [Gigaspora rosea]|nr:12428_t:CDS:1 [Gigaspora rosea]